MQSKSTKSANGSTEVFTAKERATLAEFFNHAGEPGQPGIAVLPELIEEEDKELAAEVGAIALATVQDRLLNFTTIGPEGFRSTRKPKVSQLRRVMVVPRYLFMIDWAMSAPGISWPEAYYVTFIPGFDRFVVTASRDSDDLYGCCDHAIGWFGEGVDPKAAALAIVKAWWEMARDCQEHTGWFCFLDAGSVGEDEATALREDVWPELEEEQDERRMPSRRRRVPNEQQAIDDCPGPRRSPRGDAGDGRGVPRPARKPGPEAFHRALERGVHCVHAGTPGVLG
jgi:hypothetical protein